jgi:hypothetical protein
MFIYRNPYALNVISMGRGSFNQGCQVQKNLNLATSSFKKGQILKNEKRPNKGRISLNVFVKITKLKLRIS